MPRMAHELAIIGAGMMAEAIARGILSSGKLSPEQIIAADISAERRRLFQNDLKISAVESAASAASGVGTILLATKPYQMGEVLKELSPVVRETALVVSIAAGISCATIEKALAEGERRKVIRCMPNTPMLVGAGMAALAPGAYATVEDLRKAATLFESAARVLTTTEDKMDAVTAVSGSGPAYFFFLTEQIIRAGVEMGLTQEEARTLAVQTAVGAGKMMASSPDSPTDYRRRVTTPNGTTHAAISHLEEENWAKITIDAIKLAAKRSREMGK
jgi:pyrroline-5-carboxylate reductase